MPRWAFGPNKHPMPLANPLTEITPQEEWLANYLKGKVACRANSRQENKSTQISKGSRGKLHEPGDINCEFKTRVLDGNWKSVSVNVHQSSGVIQDHHRTEDVSHSVEYQYGWTHRRGCDARKRHDCDFTNRHLQNILPSKIKNSQCYVNYRFCGHYLHEADKSSSKCCAAAPTDSPTPSGLPENGRSSFRDDETRFSSDYMKRKYREFRLRDATQQTPDIRSKSSKLSLDREKFGIKPDKTTKRSVSTQPENHGSDDRTRSLSTRTGDADDNIHVPVSRHSGLDDQSDADTDDAITKNQQGSSPRQSELDHRSEADTDDVSTKNQQGSSPDELSSTKSQQGLSPRHSDVDHRSEADSDDELSSTKSQQGSSPRHSDVDHRSEADTDDELSSTKSQQGSSPRHSDADHRSKADTDDELSSTKSQQGSSPRQSEQETHSGRRPYDGSDGKFLTGQWKRADHDQGTAARDASRKFPGSKFYQPKQQVVNDCKISTDRSSSPLFTSKRHDSPSCDKNTYSGFNSRFNSASVFVSKGKNNGAKPFTDHRRDTDGKKHLISSEECSPCSAEVVSIENLRKCLIKSQCDNTNSKSKGTNSAELPTCSHKHSEPETEPIIPEMTNLEEGCIFEKTTVSVLHDSWDPVERYQSRQVRVRNVPFFISENAMETTKCDYPSKEDKSTMVHTRHRPPVAPKPDVKTGVCAGCKLNVKHMSNYIIIGDCLRKLYTHDQLCDVIVHVGSYTFSAHRIVLVAHSAFFARLFLENSKKPPTEISLDGHGISSAGFQSVLSYIYVGEVDLSLENIGDVYTAAKFLQIRSLQSMCEDLQDHFTPDSALIVLDLAGSGRIGNDTFQRALSVVTSSFHDVCQTGTFLSLEVKQLCEILESDNLAATSELEVFQAALLWLNMDLAGRAIHMQRVMSCVRFIYMEPDEISRCTKELPGLLEDPDCRRLVLAAHCFSNTRLLGNFCQVPDDMPPRRKYLLKEAHPPTAPDIAPLSDESENASGEYIASSSGNSPKDYSLSSSDRELAEFSDNKLTEKDQRTLVEELVDISCRTTWFIEMPTVENGAHGNSTTIALIGGLAKSPACRYPCKAVVGAAMKLYDESAGSWSQHSKMLEPRYLHATAVVAGTLYVAGGADPLLGKDGILQPTNTLFKLDIENCVWSQVASMQHKRVYHKLCQLDRLLYVVGGQDENRRVLSSVEVYNAITDSWVPVAPLSKARLGMGMAAHRGLIYVVGGYSETYDNASGQHIMSNVECFNPSTNRWFQKGQLRVPRCYAELLEVNGNLYLCGGATQSFTFNKSALTSVSTLDVYDEDHDCWFVVNRWTVPRHSAAVAATGNKIYIFGGINSSEDKALKSCERYNISTNTVEKLADDMPWACLGMTAVAIPDC